MLFGYRTMWVALLGAATVTRKTNLCVEAEGGKSKKIKKIEGSLEEKGAVILLILGLLG